MLNAHHFSEVGGHAVNEDAFAVQQHPLDPELWICIVADGQGGQRGGGRAAAVACQSALAQAISLPPKKLSEPRTWSGIVATADEAVRVDPDAGYTTLVALAASPKWLAGASSGDSAAMLVMNDRTIELTAKQHKNPPVGSGAAEPISFQMALKAPWKLLAMSDGVWKYVGWERIIETAQRTGGQPLIDNLQALARLPTSGQFQDDFTIVVLEAT